MMCVCVMAWCEYVQCVSAGSVRAYGRMCDTVGQQGAGDGGKALVFPS